MLFSLFLSNHSAFEGNAATVIPAISPYFEHIKIPVENSHLRMKIYAKAMLGTFLNYFFAIRKGNINSVLKSPNKLSIGILVADYKSRSAAVY